MTTAAPDVHYDWRAGANHRPLGYADDLSVTPHTRTSYQDFLAQTGLLVYADIAEFQPPVDDRYPYPVLASRADTGGRLDNHCEDNQRYMESSDHIQVGLWYCVFIPGQTGAILRRLKNRFGAHPHPKFAFMTDMESGAGFAGPGNHSAEANAFVEELAGWAGKPRQIGYANEPDWAALWPNRPAYMHRVVASYGSTLVRDCWAQQYFGGMQQYPSPRGLPRACAPFGSWVDLNVAQMTVDQMKHSLGMEEDMTPEETANMVQNALRSYHLGGQNGIWGPRRGKLLFFKKGEGVAARLHKLEEQRAADAKTIADLQNEVAQLKKAKP